MLIVNEEVLETTRLSDRHIQLGAVDISFQNGMWVMIAPPRFLHLTTEGFARIKHSNIPIDLGEAGLLYYHPRHGLILQNW
jgi:hypothetical protein